MRTTLLLSTLLLAIAAPRCLAQSQADATVAATADASQPPSKVASGIEAPAPGAPGPKSAFGRVMAVLIDKLVQDSTQASQPPQTTDGGATATLPIDIEVGAAFRPDAAAAVASNAGAPAPGVAPPDDDSIDDATSQPGPMALQAALPATGP
jgi:hypothetical protein